MIILFSNLNKSIENYKYQISTLRNSKCMSDKDQEILRNNENIILYSKVICRVYFVLEVSNLLRKYINSTLKGKNILLMFLRMNIVWFSTLYFTKIFLKTSIERLNARVYLNNNNKFGEVENPFSNYIIHK